jgi:hypothetical protein
VLEVPRSTPRELWYYLYRLYRVVQRETLKAHVDVMLYGQGAVRVFPGGCQYVPIESVFREHQ